MTRQTRTVLPGYPHHVILRGNNRRRLFSTPSDYLRFLSYLQTELQGSECSVHALTLMSNHVHAVVTPPRADALSWLIARVAQRYAVRRNRAREASGKLFEERFISRPCTTDLDLATLIPYVDLNPVRAGRVVDGCEYPWSTYAIHAGAPERSRVAELWRPSAWYMSLGSCPQARAAAYLEYAHAALVRGDKPEPAKRIAAIEALSEQRYTRRLERPDRSRAL